MTKKTFDAKLKVDQFELKVVSAMASLSFPDTEQARRTQKALKILALKREVSVATLAHEAITNQYSAEFEEIFASPFFASPELTSVQSELNTDTLR